MMRGLERLEAGPEKLLCPEKHSFPWQVLAAEGESWLILRWKEKVADRPIRQLKQVVLEDFCGELTAEKESAQLFCGQIRLKVDYEENGPDQLTFSAEQAWREELMVEERSAVEKGEENSRLAQLWRRQAEVTEKSLFPSLLLNGNELPKDSFLPLGEKDTEEKKEATGAAGAKERTKGEETVGTEEGAEVGKTTGAEKETGAEKTKGARTWKVQAPWRCWVQECAGRIKPVCLKIHGAQVGLYTLLLEVVIKLGEDKEESSDRPPKPQAEPGAELPSAFRLTKEPGKLWTSVRENKLLLRMEDDAPAEVLGVAVERAFPCFSYDTQEQKLVWEYLRRLSVIYVSAREGGARFGIASHLEKEKALLENGAEALLPVALAAEREKGELTPVYGQTYLYSEKERFCLAMELEPESEERSASGAWGKDAGGEELLKREAPPRCKPCARWLKKANGSREKQRMTVITIKV